MNDLIEAAKECGAETGTWLDDPSTWIKFDSEAALAAFAERIRADERERAAQIADRNDAELVSYLIRAVPQRNAPRLVDGAWYWDERDEYGEWQNYRSIECPPWHAAAIRAQEGATK